MNTIKITFMNGKTFEVRSGKCLLFNMNNIMFIDLIK